ncbi:hypothetical protein [Candidatus Cyanaurora vandensis]|uniref:hypothetical protein n=1 Tax=Candidatus Cyanaurora vandensis TaxID=2714958 RepID=UPI00257FFC8B|nr:hypothetical protein [Candidatus Cyanaurora vandensis]
MENLACTLAVLSLGGIVKYFDGRIVHGLGLLPQDDYFAVLGAILMILYLSLAWNYFGLAGNLDGPTVGLTVGWIGLSWYLIQRHLKHPDAPEHILDWTGNHLLLTGCFYSLLSIKTLLT